MATVKMAGSSLMDVVTSTSGAIISTANTLSATVGWAERAMTHIRTKQSIDHKLELVDYTEKRVMENSLEHSKLMKNIRNEVNNNEDMQKDFNEHLEKLRAALKTIQE